MIFLANIARELNLTFRLLPPPNITTVLVIVSVFIPIPTTSIIYSLFLVLFGLLATLLVQQLHRLYIHQLGGMIGSRSLS